MSTRDTVNLSTREQQAFAALQSQTEQSDPHWADRLRRGASGTSQMVSTVARYLGANAWAGPLLVVLGCALMLVTVAAATWLAVLGALVVTGGLYGIGLSRHRLRQPGRRLLDRLPKPTR